MDREWDDTQPIYRQLRDRVIAMILEGVLTEGDALPSVRTVAAAYRLNPLTVLKAYQQLVDELLIGFQDRERIETVGRGHGADRRQRIAFREHAFKNHGDDTVPKLPVDWLGVVPFAVHPDASFHCKVTGPAALKKGARTIPCRAAIAAISSTSVSVMAPLPREKGSNRPSSVSAMPSRRHPCATLGNGCRFRIPWRSGSNVNPPVICPNPPKKIVAREVSASGDKFFG